MVIAMEHTSIGIADRGEISQRGTQGPIKPRRGQGIISLGADMNRARIVQRPSSREALHLSLSNGIVRALSINPTRPSSSGAESERGRIATAMAGFCLALVVLTSWGHGGGAISKHGSRYEELRCFWAHLQGQAKDGEHDLFFLGTRIYVGRQHSSWDQ